MDTFGPGSPLKLHAIVLLVPRCQRSPPLGELTVIVGAASIEKPLLLTSLYKELAVDVILILKSFPNAWSSGTVQG